MVNSMDQMVLLLSQAESVVGQSINTSPKSLYIPLYFFIASNTSISSLFHSIFILKNGYQIHIPFVCILCCCNHFSTEAGK